MKDEDLEKTKCLDEDMKELKEEKTDIYEEYKNMLREKKYSDLQEELDVEEEIESLVKENKIDTLEDKVEELEKSVEKTSIITKIKEKWNAFSKKQKIIICSVVALVLILIIIGIVIVVKNTNKKDKVGTTLPEVKEEIVIKDNYIYKNGELVFLDEDDNEIGKYECKVKDADKCYVAYNQLDDDDLANPINVYDDGSLLLNRMSIYHNKYAFIYDSEKENGAITLYDFDAHEEMDKFLLVKSYSVNNEDYVVTKNESGAYTLYKMTSSGLSKIIKKEYKYLGIIPSKKKNYVIAKLSTGYYLLDYEGTEVTKLINKNIFDYNEKYIVTKEDSVYNLYDYNNSLKISDYRFISLEDKYVVLVDKDNKLYFRNEDLLRINEEGINLSNDEYILKDVYTSNKKKTKSLFAFNNTYYDDKISVTVSNKEQDDYSYIEINLKEFNFNKDLKYYSYMDNKLFFYKDEAKEEFLGSYACSNKNESVKSGELLPNCRPALDTVFEDNDMTTNTDRVSMSPIYNLRYVFIEDSTSNNKNVKLFDLKSNSIIATYDSVNTYTANNNGLLTFVNTDKTKVIAKNKNGSFGMISISGDKVNSEYGFDYKYMEMLNSKVLAQDKDGKWKILLSKSSASNAFDGKIRGYLGNYFKVMKNDKYYVYDGDAVQISNNGFKYIELIDKDMYAAVDDDNKLMLYNYDNRELIDAKVELKSTKYYGNGSNAFMVVSDGETAIINVYDNGKYVAQNKKIIKVAPSDEPEDKPSSSIESDDDSNLENE